MKKILKWIGIFLGGLIGILALALLVFSLVGGTKANKKYDIPVETVAIPTDQESILRGEHLAVIFTCTKCHTSNLAGELLFDVPGMVSIPTPNLTSGDGGLGGILTDADWIRAIRHGVGHDGRGLMVMQSNTFHFLSDEDLGALIAFLKNIPPVDNRLPELKVEFFGRVMMGANMFPVPAVEIIDHASLPPSAPEPGETVAYGEYLSRTCTECHGANLNGAPFGTPGQEMPTPNLTPGGILALWSEADFFNTMRTGVTPGGKPISEDMPWKNFSQMTDVELWAVWLYLKSLPALDQGGR